MSTTANLLYLGEMNLDVNDLDVSLTGNMQPVLQKIIDNLLELENAPEKVAADPKQLTKQMLFGTEMLQAFIGNVEDIYEDDPKDDLTDVRHCVLVMAKVMNRLNVVAQHHHNPWLTLPSTQSLFEDFLRDSGFLTQ